MSTKTGHVMTLSNSIIGVGILAMPFCFQKCGIVLSIFLLVMSNFVTRISCYYLVKSSILCRRKSFEIMAFHVFGSNGKLLVELSIIGFLMGTCVSYFVILGDLGPHMVAKILRIENDDTLRTWTMILVTIFCVIPMGLLRNVDSLSAVCTASIGFYFCLVIKVMAESQNHFSHGDWMNHVEYWKPSGVMQCLPIISMALFCQLQLFEVFDMVQNVSLDRMYGIVKSATTICTGVYILVGSFGYIAYCTQEFSGNILLQFSPSFANDIIKIGFVLSVAFSFPLVIFPCRVSVYSLLYRRGHSDVAHYIPEHRFKCITIAIVISGLIVGIMIPSVELVIGLVGSTIGIAICVMFPAFCFIKISKKDSTEKTVAQFLLVFGFILMIMGTYANLSAIEERTSAASSEHKLIKLQNISVNMPTIKIKQIYQQQQQQPHEDIKINPEIDQILETPAPPKKVPDIIDKDAIQREDIEIAINAKPDEKLDDTKYMLKAEVNEIRDELEKRNQETQKLVMEKFEKIVQRLENTNNDEDGQNGPNDDDTKVNEIKLTNKTTDDKIVLQQNKDKPEVTTVVQTVHKKQNSGRILNPPIPIKIEINNMIDKNLIHKVEEIENKIEELEQKQAKQQVPIKQENVEGEPKKPFDAILAKVEEINERADKIKKVQDVEQIHEKDTVIVQSPKEPEAAPIKPNEKLSTVKTNPTAPVVVARIDAAAVSPSPAAIPKPIALVPAEPVVAHVDVVPVNKDAPAPAALAQGIPSPAAPVQNAAAPPAAPAQAPAAVVPDAPAQIVPAAIVINHNNENNANAQNLILQKLEVLVDKMEKIEQHQEMEMKIHQHNEANENTLNNDDKTKINGIQTKEITLQNQTNGINNTLVNKMSMNGTQNGTIPDNNRKILAAPLPITRNASIHQLNKKILLKTNDTTKPIPSVVPMVPNMNEPNKGNNNNNNSFIVPSPPLTINTNEPPKRAKRNTFLNCTEPENYETCERNKMIVV